MDSKVSFVRLNVNLNALSVTSKGMMVHRSYHKPQKYNRRFKEKHTFAPGNTYTAIDSDAAEKFARNFAAIISDIDEIPQVFFLHFDPPEADDAMLPPHVDYGRMCAVNFYLKCSGESTKFYDWDGVTREVSFNSEFVAEPSSCWLLNTSVPHSVSVKQGCERLILSLSYIKTPFTLLKTACEQKGIIF